MDLCKVGSTTASTQYELKERQCAFELIVPSLVTAYVLPGCL